MYVSVWGVCMIVVCECVYEYMVYMYVCDVCDCVYVCVSVGTHMPQHTHIHRSQETLQPQSLPSSLFQTVPLVATVPR